VTVCGRFAGGFRALAALGLAAGLVAALRRATGFFFGVGFRVAAGFGFAEGFRFAAGFGFATAFGLAAAFGFEGLFAIVGPLQIVYRTRESYPVQAGAYAA
jgi:hypothetical protein